VSLVLCGVACNRTGTPQEALAHAEQTFLHGDLEKSQEEADLGFQRLRNSDPEWAWKFRILEAKSLLWRGMYSAALSLLNSPSGLPNDKNSQIEILTIEGVAHARLHDFSEARGELDQASQLCNSSAEDNCQDVAIARGVVAVQSGQDKIAEAFFEESLLLSRKHNDHFREATALLNLGLTSLRQEHFDEAIDWTESANQTATKIDAGNIIQTALGNLGWAYYNLGDFEKSLDLSLEAEKRAHKVGNVILQLSWITNAGYVYANRGDMARAKDSYLRAFELAKNTGGKGDIYNAERALALVCVESGELEEAAKYSDQAIAIAKGDSNRLNELYPLLVKGMIAAQSHHFVEAERVFREVEHDPSASLPLKWRSQHQLARLYEDESRPDDADREYRSAIATFETARLTVHNSDSRLPFSNNASRIYDDYIHFLVTRGKPDEALRWADYSRARTLAEGLGLLASAPHNGPSAMDASKIARLSGGTLLFYWLGEKHSYLWAITPRKTNLFTLPARAEIDSAVNRYRNALGGPQDVLASSDPDGRWLYDNLIAPAQLPSLGQASGARVFVIPDGSLNNLNFETLLAPETAQSKTQPSVGVAAPSKPKLHYWIEDVTVSNSSSLRLIGAAQTNNHQPGDTKKRDRNLLLVGNSISPNDKYPELPKAAAQMDSVARHFPAAKERIFTREQATPSAYMTSDPERFSYIHFVAHGTARRLSPLDSAIVLSKSIPSQRDPRQSVEPNSKSLRNETAIGTETDSFKLYARDIIGHPLRADLVTISACYGAGERAYSGEGLVGLSWAFLRAGAHNVVAALWEATDASTEQLMDRFYDELDKGASPDAALRTAKLLLLHNSAYHAPFYWAPFQLYTGS
jgi:CHAT domain-containing protein/tetratricopeptide (TPR) repeat protein